MRAPPFPEHCITRYPAGLVDRRLVATLVTDPLHGELMVDLRVWQRDALSDGDRQPTTEALTFPARDFETLAAAVRTLIASHQGRGR